MIHVFTQNITGDRVTITGEDFNHLRNVLRVKIDDDILVSDGSGSDFIASITDVGASEITAVIVGNGQPRELPIDITLYQALPKGDKMETIIQKCVELGAARIVPVETSRCVVKLDSKGRAKKVERWQKIAQSASEQCQRSRIPEISPVMTWQQALNDAEGSQNHQNRVRNVIAYELETGAEGLKKLLTDARELNIDEIRVFVGPEGGFAQNEVDEAVNGGIMPISLGKRILRTETAGMALIAAVMLEVEAGR